MNERRQDSERLQRFTREGEQSAFADVVRRHLDLVFGTAMRMVEDPGAAQKVSQNVFAALGRKTWQFAPDDSLPAWLHKTTLFEAKTWLRGELRRRRREQVAAELGTAMNPPDEQLVFAELLPLLDQALLSLLECDRTALLLRFHENHSLREVGAAFGITEDTARKRVQSALEKLTQFFGAAGIAARRCCDGGVRSWSGILPMSARPGAAGEGGYTESRRPINNINCVVPDSIWPCS